MKIRGLDVSVYVIPTDRPEADGTISWDSTTVVLVEPVAESGLRGLGYSYASESSAELIRGKLAEVVKGTSVEEIGRTWELLVAAVRNTGRPGVAAMAISAIDVALWDLKAKLLGLPLFRLLSPYRDAVPIYGSGGFTSYSVADLTQQLGGWVAQGIPRVKMKIGTDWGTKPEVDLERVRAARQAIGPEPELMVDANGAYNAKQAIGMGQRFAEQGVAYFEEPVSSDHLEQLRFVREHVSQAVAAGEYGYSPWYIRDLLRADAVDIIQADVTRCLGATGWLMAADLAYSFGVPFSAHTSPAIHAQVGCAAPQLTHVEYFYDHARIEGLIFDGAPNPSGGLLRPDPSRPGLGLELKRQDAEKWRK